MTTWDENKRAANLAKHGVDFAIVTGFDWSTVRIEEDRDAKGEVRMRATGWIGTALYFLVYVDVTIEVEGLNGETQIVEETRIISLRKADKSEIRRYAEQQS